ncbi:MAG: hypothetical protein M1503_05875 [Thaumarchaeota archaeon]|nr:hypothetical protein [Nitrososphaerota archaeon]MCL5317773.1 hypothetical protein [Nitrososphaerota archaeon]
MSTPDSEMRCPKCRRHTLKESDDGTVFCGFCGNRLSPGQAANFRLYKLLQDERKKR